VVVRSPNVGQLGERPCGSHALPVGDLPTRAYWELETLAASAARSLKPGSPHSKFQRNPRPGYGGLPTNHLAESTNTWPHESLL
jgi:hypothetical protein